MSSHFVGLLWHWPTYCHSQSGLGVTVWHPSHLSFHADSGVLLQHAWNWFFVPLFITHVQGTHIVVTSNIASEVLHVPREKHPDYPSFERLRTVSKDKLISAFYERPSDWGEGQFTYCSSVAKSPRFLNMVMTFVFHPLSHYNSLMFLFLLSSPSMSWML